MTLLHVSVQGYNVDSIQSRARAVIFGLIDVWRKCFQCLIPFFESALKITWSLSCVTPGTRARRSRFAGRCVRSCFVLFSALTCMKFLLLEFVCVVNLFILSKAFVQGTVGHRFKSSGLSWLIPRFENHSVMNDPIVQVKF